jgi:uncharacterized protein
MGMRPETLEAAWAFLFPDGTTRRGTSIRFGSGEPLLAYPLLRRLGEMIRERGGAGPTDRPDVFLTTNGTLVDAEVGDWLASSGWHIKISLDGPQPIQDSWRVKPNGRGTFAVVSSAVANLARRIPDRFSVTAVLCRGADPQQVFDAIAGFGVRRIELVPVAHHDTLVRPAAVDVKRYGAFVRDYARRYIESDVGDEPPVLVRFADCVARVMGYDNRRVACGAGRTFFGVDADGDLYPCFRFIGVTPYRLGSVSTGLDADAVAGFWRGPGRPYERRVPCSQCWAAPLCGGPCFACAEMFGAADGLPMPAHCAYILADARAAVWLVSQLRRHCPRRLLSLLPRTALQLSYEHKDRPDQTAGAVQV